MDNRDFLSEWEKAMNLFGAIIVIATCYALFLIGKNMIYAF